jgi:nanoRNase/pAp phosphatase (c-di-AMP/oligoRNAs hydrolase)
MDSNNHYNDPVVDLIQKSNSIAIMPSIKGGIDAYCAGAGLYTLLREKGKKVSMIYDGNVPKVADDLVPQEEVLRNVTERELLVSVDYSGTSATKMNYEVENEVLNFRLGPVSKDYDINKIRSKLVGHSFDLIFTVGIKSFGDLGDVYTELSSSFNSGHVVNVDNDDNNTRFARNNLIDSSHDSLSVMMLNVGPKWDLKLTSNSARALLTGISYKNG